MLTVDISLPEIEELKALVQEGHEKGYLTFDEVATTLEEIELTKEQLEDFYTYLLDHNIELLDAESRQTAQQDAVFHGEKPPELDLTVEPSLDSLRLYLREIGKVALLDRRPGGQPGQAHRARRHAGQAADDRGQPAPRRLDREGLPGPRALASST